MEGRALTKITKIDERGIHTEYKRGYTYGDNWTKTGLAPNDGSRGRSSFRSFIRVPTQEDRDALDKRSLVNAMEKVDWGTLSLNDLIKVSLCIPHFPGGAGA